MSATVTVAIDKMSITELERVVALAYDAIVAIDELAHKPFPGVLEIRKVVDTFKCISNLPFDKETS